MGQISRAYPQFLATTVNCSTFISSTFTDAFMSSTAILVFKVWREDTCEGKVVVSHYKDHFVVSDDE
jgi:hypothetical protein